MTQFWLSTNLTLIHASVSGLNISEKTEKGTKINIFFAVLQFCFKNNNVTSRMKLNCKIWVTTK